MDPDAALRALDKAIDDRDRQGVFEYSDALIGWMRGGGFNPMDNRIGNDWRGMFTRGEMLAYLGEINSATGIKPNGEDADEK